MHELLLERTQLEREISAFLESPGAGFLYLRGRRRIGKSWLLARLREKHRDLFLFSGSLDASNSSTLKDFAKSWDAFSGIRDLTRLKISELSWKVIFDCITTYAQGGARPLTLAFDEIQWIASGRSGFIGDLKTAWVDWERKTNIKVIVCGSSSRFFSKFTGSESKILRGLQTRSDVQVNEFSLTEVYRQIVPEWSLEEAIFLYMIVGGVPYYLQRIAPRLGFIQAINQAFFTGKTIFLDEWKELLSLDYNSRGIESAARVLSSLIVEQGQTLSEIAIASGLSEEVVFNALNTLEQYGYVSPRIVSGLAAPSQRKTGVRYIIQDAYLDFYFSVLRRNELLIRENSAGLLFPRLTFYPVDSFHVPNFSGHAFERVVAKVLRGQLCFPSKLSRSLGLLDNNFDIYQGLQVKNSTKISGEIDILLVHREDRCCRVIECKWTRTQDFSHISEVHEKELPAKFRDLRRLNILITLYTPSADFVARAQASGVVLVGIDLLVQNS